MNSIRWIVIYDITDDALRAKISDRLKDYGLERIQFSAFLGPLLRHRVTSLHTDLRSLLSEGEDTDSILMLPVCESCFSMRIEIGAQKEMVKDEKAIRIF